jgi:trans-aconitate methyltransferase
MSSLYKRGDPDGCRNLQLPQPYYERIYAEDRHRKRGTWRPWQKQGGKFLCYAVMQLATPPILDLGCGSGHLAEMLAAFGRKEHYALGMDYCPSAILMAKRRAPWATFASGNAAGHPELLARRIYRTAVLLEVLEHIYEDRELLSAIPRGRYIVASVPDFPTRGHCRYFGTALEVKQRYGDLISFERIVVEHGIASDNRWFLFQGRRL